MNAKRPVLPPPPRPPSEASTIADLARRVGSLEGASRAQTEAFNRLAEEIRADREASAKARERLGKLEGELRAVARRSGGGVAAIVSAAIAAIGHVLAGK